MESRNFKHFINKHRWRIIQRLSSGKAGPLLAVYWGRGSSALGRKTYASFNNYQKEKFVFGKKIRCANFVFFWTFQDNSESWINDWNYKKYKVKCKSQNLTFYQIPKVVHIDPQGSMMTFKGSTSIMEIHDSGWQLTLLISILFLLWSQIINILTWISIFT